MCHRDPGSDRVPCLLGNLELNGPLGLLLHDNRDVTALDHVVNAKPDQIASAQLAVDCEIEQREFSAPMIELKSNSDSPDLFQLQRRLLAEQLAFVPWDCTSCSCRPGIHERLLG
jgi:hypothetical protein